MKKFFLAALLALLPAFACAQPPAETAPANTQANVAAPAPARAPLPGADRDADPALLVVRDEDTTIYLFGTIHMLDGRTWFNDEVKTAFDASAELVLEARLPEDSVALATRMMQMGSDTPGPPISSRLTPAQNEALNRALDTIGVPRGGFERFEPWFVGLTLTAALVQQLGMSPENGPETILTRAAQARRIPIGELEGMEYQLRIFDSMPQELQMRQLRQTLDQLHRVEAIMGPMVAAWSAGDLERIAAITDEEEGDDADSRALRQVLFVNRNNAWADWIKQRLDRPGTVFIAVGAGHLAGPDSVQNVLRARGIETARIPHVVAR